MLEISPNPSDSVNKCKTVIKTYLLMQPCHFNFLICRFELLIQTVITQDSNRIASPPKNKLTSMKTHRYEAGYLHSFIYIHAFSRCFYPKQLTVHSGYTFLISMCVPWESNPRPFALLTQCSTTEPHRNTVLSMIQQWTMGICEDMCDANAQKHQFSNLPAY